jgi:hypothetical protein
VASFRGSTFIWRKAIWSGSALGPHFLSDSFPFFQFVRHVGSGHCLEAAAGIVLRWACLVVLDKSPVPDWMAMTFVVMILPNMLRVACGGVRTDIGGQWRTLLSCRGGGGVQKPCWVVAGVVS